MSNEVELIPIKCRGVGTFEPTPQQKVLFEQIALALPAMPDHESLAMRFRTDVATVQCAISWAAAQAIRR